ncbi:tail fiber protein [Rosenbergiella epipactidis]|uniref:tail fiber protein n=1 Tax=Rosenbergiella epipactidis TaxID=1544694 RepID=UPI001F4E8ED7|nr:tail fiber protein [Rosenbergiella epipactidis]
MGTVGFSQDNALPLMADIQYMEPYASSALNRKFKNILLAGFYSGYIPLPGSGLNLLITSAQSAGGLGTGVASIDTNGFQISVQQNADITVGLAAGKSHIIALQADYQFGTITNQVDANSTVKATQIVTLDINAKLQPNQIELCRVVIPAGAKQITKAMISTLYRVDRLIGITLSDRIDLADSNTGASSLAVKTAYETAVKYADDNKAAIGNNSDITDLNAIRNLGKNNLSIGGYVSIYNGMAVTAESRFASGGFIDPYVGRALAIKASGGMAVNGDVFFNNALTVKGGVNITNGASVTGDLTVDDVTITGTVVGAMPSRVLPPNYSDGVWHKIANIPNAGSGANWLTLMLTAGNYGGTQMGHDVLSFTGRNMPAKDTPWTSDIAQRYVNHVQLMVASANGAQIGVVANISGGVYQSFDFYIKSPQWWSGATVSITGGTGYNYYGNNLTSVKTEPDGIQYITPVAALTTLSPKYDLAQADMNLNSLNLNNPLSIQNGGTGARNTPDARKNLGLGSAAVYNIGTSGNNVPILNVKNTWVTQQTFDDGIKVNDEITSTSLNALRLVSANNGMILRKDNGTFFFLVSTDNNGLGQWNALRPLQISMTNGLLQSANGQIFSGNTTINDTLTLKNALDMSSGGTGANNLDDARKNLQLDRLKQGDTETQLFSAKGANYLYVSEGGWGAYTAGKGFLALGIGQGGTGANDAAGARNNLGLGSAALMTSTTANYDGLSGRANEVANTTQLVQLRDAAALKGKENAFGPMQSFQSGVALSNAPGGNANSNGIFNGPADGAAYDKYNLEIRSWYGIGLRDTCYNKTNIFFNVRDGSMGMTGGINASGLTTSSDVAAGGYSITNKEFISKGQNGLRIANGGSGILLRKDGGTFYILSVADDANTTTWNTLRPFSIDIASGRVTMANGQILAGGQTLSGNTTINDTLTLANALSIANGGTGATDAAGARNNLGLAAGALMTKSAANYDGLAGNANESASTLQLVQLREAAALKGKENTFTQLQHVPGLDITTAPGGSNGMFGGSGDGASYDKYNLQISSWYGIGLYDTAGKKTNIVFNVRNGSMNMTGGINANTLNTDNDINSSGYVITTKEFISKGANGLRIAKDGSGVLLRKDGNTFYILSVDDDANTTTWNTMRPFAMDIPTGRVTMANGQILAGGQTLSGNTTINDTLTLANALAISSGGTGAKDAAGARNNLGLGSAALMTTTSASYDGMSGLATESASTVHLVQLRNASALKGQANTFGPTQSFQGGLALPNAPGGQATSNGLFNGPADGSDYSKYNVELRTWWGLAIRDTCNNKTNIVFDARTGDIDTVGTVNTKGLYVAGNYLTVNGGGASSAFLGSGPSDIYLFNTKSAMHLQLKDDGTLQYENQPIYHTGNKPSMQELMDATANTGNIPLIADKDDLNNYLTAGMWRCDSVAKVITNAPATGVRFNLTVLNVQTGIPENGTTQIAYVSSDGTRPRVYVRCYSNKTWSLWVDMASNVFPNGATVKQNLTVDGGDLTVNSGYFRGIDNYHYLYVGTRYSNVPEIGTWGGYFGFRDTNSGTITTKLESGKITTLGSILAVSDNSMISIGNDSDFALVKKSGTKAKIVVGNGTPFIVAVSNAATVEPSNTQTDLFRVDTDGSGTFKNNVKVNGSSLTIVGPGSSNLNIGSGSGDVYLQNSKTNKFLQLSDDGYLRYSGSKVYHEGNKPTTAELGFSIDNTRYYNANDEKRKWVRIAIVNVPNGGQCAYLTIYGGAGYNAGSLGQAAKTEIIVRAGNGSPANSITAVAYVQGSTPIDPTGGFGWKFTSNNNYEIWANVRNYTQGHIVEGRASTGVLIDYSDAAQADEPDGLTDGKIYYMQYGDALGQSYTKDEADSRYIEAAGDTMKGPLTFANATWNPFGDDVEVGDVNQGGSLGIRSRNDTTKTGLAFYQKGANAPSGWMQCYSNYVNFTNELRTGGDFTASGYSYTNKEFISKGANGLRIANSGNGVLLRKDGGTFYILTTTDDSSGSTWTGLRPFSVDIASGKVTMANGQNMAGGQILAGGQTLSGNTTINDTLTLANALAISNGGTGSDNLGGARTNLQVDRLKQASNETQLFASGGKNYLYVNDNGWGAFTAGVGYLALAIGQGGTGATDAAGARNNLGLAAGALMTKSAANYDGLSGGTNEAATTTQLVQLRNATPLKHQANTFGPMQSFQGGLSLPSAPGGNANSIGFFNGPGDGAAWDKYNLEIRSWFGIGFRDTCYNKTNIVFDLRAGTIWNQGEIRSASNGIFGGTLYAGDAVYQTDGNVKGSVWGGYLSAWLNQRITDINNNTTNAYDHATDGINRANSAQSRADDAWNKANDAQWNRVQDIRLAGQDFIYAGRNVGAVRAPGGAVLVGAEVNGEWDNNERLMYAFIQKCVGNNWYTIGQA